MSTYGPTIPNPSLEVYGVPASPPAPPTPNVPLSPFTVLRTVWLTAATNGGTGSGQAYDPYQVPNAATLATLFATIPAFTRIYFAPGTYLLPAAGLAMKDGQMIEGAGIDSTIIKLDTNAFTGSGQALTMILQFFAGTDGTFGSVRNLTVDPNLANQSGVTGVSTGDISAIGLQSMQMLIEDVKVLGWYSNPGEGFPVRCVVSNVATKTALNPAVANIRRVEFIGNGSSATGFASASLISCFDQTAPDGTTFTNQWMTGSITECTIVNAPAAIGFGAGGWYNFNVQRNKVQNVGSFMIQDTHKGWNVTVRDNTAEDLAGSYFLDLLGNNANQYKNYRILNNTSRVKSGNAGFGHISIASPDMSDLLIEGNLFDANGTTTASNQNLWSVNTPSGGIIRNNRASTGYFFQSLAGGSVIGPTLENNIHFDGTPIQDTILGSNQRGTPFTFTKCLRNVDLKSAVETAILTVPTGMQYCLQDFYIVGRTVVALSAPGTFLINNQGVGQMSEVTTVPTTLAANLVLSDLKAAPPVSRRIAQAGSVVTAFPNGAVTATTCLVDVYIVGFYL